MLESILSSSYASSLEKDDKKILESFLIHYAEISQPGYISAISLINDLVNGKSFREYNFVDYKKVVNTFTGRDNAQDKYRKSFFRYLFASDYLNNPDRFYEIWIKENELRHFNNKKNNTSVESVVQVILKPEEMIKLEDLIDCNDSVDFDVLQASFYAFLLVKTDINIDNIRNKMSVYDYSDGMFGNYIVPPKYGKVFDILKDNHRAKRLTRSFSEAIEKCNQILNVEGMLPKDIRKGSLQYQVLCCNCGEYYSSKSSNWRIANGRLICIECADTLKKNYKIERLISIDDPTYAEMDYLDIYRKQLEVGAACEKFVVEYEKSKLKGTAYEILVDGSKANNPINGYDIFSYETDGTEIYIEVKGTSEAVHNSFFISNSELCKMNEFKEQNKIYRIYSVSNIFAKNRNDIKLKIFEDIYSSDFTIQVNTWKVNIKQ